MLKQDSVIKQTNSKIVKIDDEIRNIENVMMKIFNIPDEDDKQGLVGGQKDLSVLTGNLKGISV